MNDLLKVSGLNVSYKLENKKVNVVRDVSFEIHEGEILGMVGESGSGKSVTSKSILRLINPPGKIESGQILLDGEDILQKSQKMMQKIRGNKISMIFQEPMTSLNPLFTCGEQIIEAITLHQNVSKKEAREKAIEMLRLVSIPNPELRVDCYPHELSGGMRQRVMIAIALSCNPELLIADEPTTALDPTIQAQINELIKEIQIKLNMSVLYITHDLGVVAGICDRVIVMYAGQVVEVADVVELFKNPGHPYTACLMKAIPKINEKRDRLYTIKGIVPHMLDMPTGCTFHPRCPVADDKCKNEMPDVIECRSGHCVRCWKAFNFKDQIT